MKKILVLSLLFFSISCVYASKSKFCTTNICQSTTQSLRFKFDFNNKKNIDHPIYISVFKLEYRSEKKALEIIIIVFIDDLVTVWEKENRYPFQGTKRLDIEDEKNYNHVVKNMEEYLAQHLNIKLNKTQIKPKMLGFEIKKDAFHFYLNKEDIEKIEELNVNCTFFVNDFESQQNLFFFKMGDKEYSARMNEDRISRTLFP